MWWAVLPVVDPAMKLVNGTGFFVSHLVYGAMLGAGLAVVRGHALPQRRDADRTAEETHTGYR
jgi:hypothetical protein